MIVAVEFSSLRPGMGKLLWGILLFASVTAFAETNDARTAEDLSWQRHVIESYQTLQDQQQATQRAIDQARQEAEAAARRNAESIDARLQQIEDGLTTRHAREIESLQSSHRFTLILLGTIGGAGLIGLIFVALLLLRAVNRRSAFVGPAIMAENSMGLTTLDPARQANARLRANLDRLEQRLGEIEATTQAVETGPDVGDRIALLLGKGQALLNMQQPDTALECFDEAISLDATNAEAFVKKGTALEKLGRLDDAIDCYDRAIAADTSMTMAYLCKGGVFNRLERYGEALQCYEQALRVHQKPGVT